MEMVTEISEDRLPLLAPSDEFERRMKETRRRAYSMALQLTRNPNDAEDLVQETYVKAWRRYDTYVDGRPFLNWLLRIMQRAYLDNRRRDNPIRKAESLNQAFVAPDGSPQEVNIPDGKIDLQKDLESLDFAGEVHDALTELPEIYRDAIYLCDIEQLSYHEIAEAQSTTIGTVRSRIHRGRRLLKEVILRRGRLNHLEF